MIYVFMKEKILFVLKIDELKNGSLTIKEREHFEKLTQKYIKRFLNPKAKEIQTHF